MSYSVKEEAKEIKDNLVKNRDSFIMLVVAGVVGGVITRIVIPKSVTEGSIFDRLKSLFDRDD
jgi:hypothetical protein